MGKAHQCRALAGSGPMGRDRWQGARQGCEGWWKPRLSSPRVILGQDVGGRRPPVGQGSSPQRQGNGWVVTERAPSMRRMAVWGRVRVNARRPAAQQPGCHPDQDGGGRIPPVGLGFVTARRRRGGRSEGEKKSGR